MIFGDEDFSPEQFVFEWSCLGTADLISKAPRMGAEALTPCYGVIHRTEDWPDAIGTVDHSVDPWRLFTYEGTKIGGAPNYIQGEPTVSGRFLATLGSISTHYSRYPLLNPSETPDEDNYLIFGDMGSLYLFLDEGNGRVLVEDQWY